MSLFASKEKIDKKLDRLVAKLQEKTIEYEGHKFCYIITYSEWDTYTTFFKSVKTSKNYFTGCVSAKPIELFNISEDIEDPSFSKEAIRSFIKESFDEWNIEKCRREEIERGEII